MAVFLHDEYMKKTRLYCDPSRDVYHMLLFLAHQRTLSGNVPSPQVLLHLHVTATHVHHGEINLLFWEAKMHLITISLTFLFLTQV